MKKIEKKKKVKKQKTINTEDQKWEPIGGKCGKTERRKTSAEVTALPRRCVPSRRQLFQKNSPPAGSFLIFSIFLSVCVFFFHFCYHYFNISFFFYKFFFFCSPLYLSLYFFLDRKPKLRSLIWFVFAVVFIFGFLK